MKKISGYIAFFVCLVLISSFNVSVFAQEGEMVITDKIIEMDPDRRLIQVRNRHYHVTTVFIDDGRTKEPRTGLFYDLKVDDVVEVHVKGKSDGFWQTEKVIIYTGEKKKEFLENRE